MIDKQLSLSDRPFNMSIFFPTAIKFERKFFSVLYGRYYKTLFQSLLNNGLQAYNFYDKPRIMVDM